MLLTHSFPIYLPAPSAPVIAGGSLALPAKTNAEATALRLYVRPPGGAFAFVGEHAFSAVLDRSADADGTGYLVREHAPTQVSRPSATATKGGAAPGGTNIDLFDSIDLGDSIKI